jgi:hypothetical protein
LHHSKGRLTAQEDQPMRQPSNLAELQRVFVTIMPRIEQHGHIYFRHKPHDRREELIAEMIALSWRWFVRLTQRGKDPTEFVSALATYAAKAVNAGRRVCGMEKPKDVLSPVAQKHHGFSVGKLPDFSTLGTNPLMEALIDNTQTPVDEAAAFRIDFPAWLSRLDDRRRRIAEDLMIGERTLDVANRHGISSTRISQLRREYREDWTRFCE